jgi:DNA-binding transcriptional LysR family regulator
MLGQPQPAISRQISRLEDECGGRLFNRTGRGVTLTQLGEALLPKIVSLLQGASELSAQLDEGARLPSGEVRLGALPSLYMVLGVPLFFELRKAFPGIRLQIFEGSGGQIDQWLANGFVDIGLPYRYGKTHQAVGVDPLVRVSSYVMGAPGGELTADATVRFAALDGRPLVLPGTPSSVRLALDQMARQANITLNVALQADSTQIQKAIAKLGGACAVLPAHAAIEEIEAGTLQISRIVEPEFNRTIVLVMTSARTPSRAARQVARTIRELFGRNRDYWVRSGAR